VGDFKASDRASERAVDLKHVTERSRELKRWSSELIARSEETLERVRRGEHVGNRVAELTAEVAGLRRALESRAVIEQAKGVIMARVGCDADAAFEVLVHQSQSENRKLREIAQGLVDASVRRRPAPSRVSGPGR
jgi:hypothetical protein